VIQLRDGKGSMNSVAGKLKQTGQRLLTTHTHAHTHTHSYISALCQYKHTHTHTHICM